MNRLNVRTLTPELLAGPTFELMKGTCKSLTELEYFCEEVYKATTEKLDWINPEGRQYPHDLRKPLPLVPNSQGRHVIPFLHSSITNLEYLVVESQPQVLYFTIKNSLSEESQIGARSEDNSMHLRPQGNQLVTSTQKEELLLSQSNSLVSLLNVLSCYGDIPIKGNILSKMNLNTHVLEDSILQLEILSRISSLKKLKLSDHRLFKDGGGRF
ncbi:hypothetical protein Tco_0987974 [Tanacetum coccineum]|uniref:Uncharacterized protein n=1 Tax=Tanacetum coccineum TaxID=301880 RepID=A0ABQ5EPV3_9ASTR